MPIEIGQLTRWLRQTRDADTGDEYRRDSYIPYAVNAQFC